MESGDDAERVRHARAVSGCDASMDDQSDGNANAMVRHWRQTWVTRSHAYVCGTSLGAGTKSACGCDWESRLKMYASVSLGSLLIAACEFRSDLIVEVRIATRASRTSS